MLHERCQWGSDMTYWQIMSLWLPWWIDAIEWRRFCISARWSHAETAFSSSLQAWSLGTLRMLCTWMPCPKLLKKSRAWMQPSHHHALVIRYCITTNDWNVATHKLPLLPPCGPLDNEVGFRSIGNVSILWAEVSQLFPPLSQVFTCSCSRSIIGQPNMLGIITEVMKLGDERCDHRCSWNS